MTCLAKLAVEDEEERHRRHKMLLGAAALAAVPATLYFHHKHLAKNKGEGAAKIVMSANSGMKSVNLTQGGKTVNISRKGGFLDRLTNWHMVVGKMPEGMEGVPRYGSGRGATGKIKIT